MNKELRNIAASAARIGRVRQLIPAVVTGRGGMVGLTRNIAALSDNLTKVGIRVGPGLAQTLGVIGSAAGGLTGAFGVLASAVRIVGGVFGWLGRVALGALRAMASVVGRVMARLRTLAVVGAASVAAFVYAGTRAVNTYADFEQAVRNAMTVTGLFGSELERAEAVMSRFARQVAARSTKTATDVANAYYALASAGLSVKEIMAATPGIIALAEATQSELGTTTELVTASLRAFRLEASQTNRVVNTFAAAISASPLNMERLAYSLQYVAPVAAAFGMTIEDTVSALAMLAKAGIYGSIAGTALRGMLTREEAPAEKATKILRRYGLTLRDVSVQQVGFANVLRNLRAAGVRPADVMQIFGLRAGPAVLALLRQGPDEFLRIRREITGTNFAFRLQALQLQTIQGQWKILRSQLEEARHSFGQAARGGVMLLLRTLQRLLAQLRRFGFFAAMGGIFSALASGAARLADSLRPLAPALVGIAAAFRDVFLQIARSIISVVPDAMSSFGDLIRRLPQYIRYGFNRLRQWWIAVVVPWWHRSGSSIARQLPIYFRWAWDMIVYLAKAAINYVVKIFGGLREVWNQLFGPGAMRRLASNFEWLMRSMAYSLLELVRTVAKLMYAWGSMQTLLGTTLAMLGMRAGVLMAARGAVWTASAAAMGVEINRWERELQRPGAFMGAIQGALRPVVQSGPGRAFLRGYRETPEPFPNLTPPVPPWQRQQYAYQMNFTFFVNDPSTIGATVQREFERHARQARRDRVR